MADRLMIAVLADPDRRKNRKQKRKREKRNGFALVLPLMMLMIVSLVVVFCASQLKMQIQLVQAARLSSLYQNVLEQSKEMAANIVYQRKCLNDVQIETIRTFETEEARITLRDCTNYLEATIQRENRMKMVLWIYYSDSGLLGYEIQEYNF